MPTWLAKSDDSPIIRYPVPSTIGGRDHHFEDPLDVAELHGETLPYLHDGYGGLVSRGRVPVFWSAHPWQQASGPPVCPVRHGCATINPTPWVVAW